MAAQSTGGRIVRSFQEDRKAEPGRPEDRVRVELLTDPWSVWCWGFEPVRRTLDLRFPTIDFQFRLGGMFEHMPDPESMGFDLERFFEQVHRATGMPTRTRSVHEGRPESTWPACIYVHAAHMASPGMERRFLRALRESVYLDGRNVSDRGVAKQVATVVGIDPDGFDAALDDGTAESRFRDTVQALQEENLTAYPTLLVTAQGRTTRVEGFQSLPGVLAIAEAVSGRIHAPLPDPPIEKIIPHGERVVTREVAEVLGTSVERAYDLLREAEDQGLLLNHRHPKGDVWTRSAETEPEP